MPTSSIDQIPAVMSLMMNAYPKSVLDVGVGFGKYGFLAREYLDVSDGREDYSCWKTRIDGIEVFEEYLTPIHEFVYNEVYVGNALEVLPKIRHRYDLVLLIDVLEHFEFDDGVRLVQQCQRVGANILISTPKDIGVQSDAFGNPFETHRFQWQRRHIKAFGSAVFASSRRHHLAIVGQDAWKIRLRRHGWLVDLYRRLRPSHTDSTS